MAVPPVLYHGHSMVPLWLLRQYCGVSPPGTRPATRCICNPPTAPTHPHSTTSHCAQPPPCDCRIPLTPCPPPYSDSRLSGSGSCDQLHTRLYVGTAQVWMAVPPVLYRGNSMVPLCCCASTVASPPPGTRPATRCICNPPTAPAHPHSTTSHCAQPPICDCRVPVTPCPPPYSDSTTIGSRSRDQLRPRPPGRLRTGVDDSPADTVSRPQHGPSLAAAPVLWRHRHLGPDRPHAKSELSASAPIRAWRPHCDGRGLLYS